MGLGSKGLKLVWGWGAAVPKSIGVRVLGFRLRGWGVEGSLQSAAASLLSGLDGGVMTLEESGLGYDVSG